MHKPLPQERSSRAYGRAGGVASEAISNIRTVAAFGLEDATLRAYSSALAAPTKVGDALRGLGRAGTFAYVCAGPTLLAPHLLRMFCADGRVAGPAWRLHAVSPCRACTSWARERGHACYLRRCAALYSWPHPFTCLLAGAPRILCSLGLTRWQRGMARSGWQRASRMVAR